MVFEESKCNCCYTCVCPSPFHDLVKFIKSLIVRGHLVFSSCCLAKYSFDGLRWSCRVSDWAVVDLECRATRVTKKEPIFHLLSKDFLPIGLQTPAVLKLDQIGLKSGRWWASPKKVERPKRPWKECREETRCKAEGSQFHQPTCFLKWDGAPV